jgi:hypothetical protein
MVRDRMAGMLSRGLTQRGRGKFAVPREHYLTHASGGVPWARIEVSAFGQNEHCHFTHVASLRLAERAKRPFPHEPSAPT